MRPLFRALDAALSRKKHTLPSNLLSRALHLPLHFSNSVFRPMQWEVSHLEWWMGNWSLGYSSLLTSRQYMKLQTCHTTLHSDRINGIPLLWFKEIAEWHALCHSIRKRIFRPQAFPCANLKHKKGLLWKALLRICMFEKFLRLGANLKSINK